MNFEDLNDTLLETFESFDNHEQVRKFNLDGDITAYIAIHNTNLGPSLGGARMCPYASDREAINDVLRLSRGMTYKNAMAGLPLGGGKAVIIGNPFEDKTMALMEAMGQAVESLEGEYITAEDSGTGEKDMVAIARHTEHVTGLPPEMLKGKGFGELGGNPSPLTALGVYRGIQSAAALRYGKEDLRGLSVAVQGVGAVGVELCKLLQQDGVRIIAADVNDKMLAEAQESLAPFTIVSPNEIYGVKADIFAPCAMGGVLNDDTIPQLQVDIVAGASNNQLLATYHDKMLADMNILYVPDYVINAGGVICVGYEYFRKSDYNPLDFEITRERMISHVENIGQNVKDVLEYAQGHNLHPGEAADKLAEEKFLNGEALRDSSSEPPASFGSAGGMTLVQ
ncbi:MAG: Glu/Leu/Phe/Val dehydrogenase [Rhodospirillales bacterium]|nr:Glu/Leu/Phe/Val dehydrogenase [Alphaproteobacteria bacterium]USO03701.1 MAG: Glu/Leu/Phe/Val dehydrogenase [Rhodospirillales bacterium]